MVSHQRLAAWAALAALVICGGCWEEIHYTPPAETSVAEDAAAKRGTPPPEAVMLDTPAAPPPGAPVVLDEPATAPPTGDAPLKLP